MPAAGSRAMPAAGLGTRLRTTPWLCSIVPAPMALRLAQRRGARAWRERPQERARAAMTAVVGGTGRAGEVEDLARQHLIESYVHRVMFWRVLRTARLDESSWSRLHKALSDERGVLLSSCHTGPIFQTMSVIAAQGRSSFCVAGEWFFERPGNDYWGRRIARWWRIAQRRREHVIPAKGSFPVLRGLLGRGELVWLLFDMPGSRETRFLGKPVMLASGSARLAGEADALVLPLRTRRSGHRVWVDVAAPLDPRDFPDHEQLHDALAAVHERWILEFPAALEDPRREGAWEEGATASGWIPARRRPGGAEQ